MTRRSPGKGSASGVKSDRGRASTGWGRRLRHCMVSMTLALCLAFPAFTAVFGSQEKMKGPEAKRHRHTAHRELETSAPRIVLLGALTLFQGYISPVDGERCGFEPSCSAFARQALGRTGIVHGILATSDRLMRCTLFKEQGPDYLLLPDGKLFDPVDNNLLSSP